MKKIAAHLKAKLSARLSRTPLWVSFMLMTSLLLLASTLLLSLFNYNFRFNQRIQHAVRASAEPESAESEVLPGQSVRVLRPSGH